jgi:flavin-binding protein dodecin
MNSKSKAGERPRRPLRGLRVRTESQTLPKPCICRLKEENQRSLCLHVERIAYNSDGIQENGMTQKIIEVIGTSKESFAKAAEAAVQEAAKTVRGIKWAHVDSFDMQLDGTKVLQYRATAKIFFDVEH